MTNFSEGFNTPDLIISDSELLSIDESTGNIQIPYTMLTSTLVGGTISIHYKEDNEDVRHQYKVTNIDKVNNVIDLTWIRQLGEQLCEDSKTYSVSLDGDEMFDPKGVSFIDKIKNAKAEDEAAQEADRIAKETAKKMERVKFIVDKLDPSNVDCLDDIFEEVVPPSGPATTVGGELIRAIVRIMYRDYNDGDKFFAGYGIETCGSSAQYLHDNGFEDEIDRILDKAFLIIDNDTAYTDEINKLASSVIKYCKDHPEVFWTENTTDSRDYDVDYIVESQPRFSYVIDSSDDVATLIENNIVTAWDLNDYVEEALSWDREFEGAEVSRPYSSYSDSVEVNNLTIEGYDKLQEWTEHGNRLERFWSEFVDQYADELESLEDDDSDESEEDED